MEQGIHNVFVVIPQFLVTGLSAIVFAIAEPGLTVTDVRTAGDSIVSVNATIAEFAARSQPEPTSEALRPFDSIGSMFRYEYLSHHFLVPLLTIGSPTD